MAKKKQNQYSGIGGQAVLEGVMMKNKEKYAVAVRKPDGEIDVQVEEYKGIGSQWGITKVPFIRGIFAFIDSLVLGMRVTMHSASFYEDEEVEENQSGQEKEPDLGLMEKAFGSKADDFMMGITVVISVIIAVSLFMLLPFFISDFMANYIRNDSVIAILEGVIRILIFVGYIVAISFMKDIRRLFMYHGAEHKCINCIEKGRPLTVKDVMLCSRQHKRCGTSFLLFVVLVSVVVFFFIRVDNLALKLVIRLALVPVIAGISYEIIRLAGRCDNILVRIISAPGMMMQRLTTKEPDEDMVKVAIASVEAVFDWQAYLKETFQLNIEDTYLPVNENIYDEEEYDESALYEEDAYVENEHSEETYGKDAYSENVIQSEDMLYVENTSNQDEVYNENQNNNEFFNNTKYNGRGSHSELSDIDLLNKESFAQNKYNAALHSGGVLEDHLYYEGTDHEEHVKDELPMDNFYSPERSDKE